jgi:hypothetical protein
MEDAWTSQWFLDRNGYSARKKTAQTQSQHHSICTTDCPTGKSINCLTSPLFKNISLNASGKSKV